MTETLMFQVKSARASFMVAFHDRILPDDRSPAPDEVEQIKRRMLADLSAGPVRYDDIILHNYPGFQIEVASARGVFVTRVYFVSRRVYQLGVDADSNFKEKDRLKFFDSFELTS